MYWGTILEDIVAQEFAKRTGYKVRNNNFTLQSEQYPYLLANIDREIVGLDAGLECKTANAFKAEEWQGDSVPDAYYIQCQHYMAVTGKASWWIACLVGGNTFYYKEIKRNEEIIQAIIDTGAEFWRLVETKTMPAPDDSKACSEALKKLYRNSNGKAIELSAQYNNVIVDYLELKEQLAELESKKRGIENLLKDALGDNEKGSCGEHYVSWKSSKPRETFDSKKFKSDHPDLYTNYIKQGEPSRRFEVK